MMSVKEYALDINVTVEAVIKKAQELGYDIKNADDMLDEDQIIDLDNTLTMNVNEEEEPEYIDEITEEKDYDLDAELEDKAEELASASHIRFDDTVKKQTGNVYSQKYLRLFSADIPLFFKSKTGSFYTDEEVNNARVFGKDLPFGIRTLTLTEYDRKPIRYSKEQALDKCREKNSKYEKNFLSEYKIKNKTESIKYTDKCVRLEITYSLYGNICEEAAFFIKK